MATHYDTERAILTKIVEEKNRVMEALDYQVKQYEREHKPVKTVGTFKHCFKVLYPTLNYEEYTKEAATRHNDPICMKVQERIEELKAQNKEWSNRDARYKRMKETLTRLRIDIANYKKRLNIIALKNEEESDAQKEVDDDTEASEALTLLAKKRKIVADDSDDENEVLVAPKPPKKKIRVVVEDSVCNDEDQQCVVCATNYACITSVECNHKVVCLDCLTQIHETSGQNKTRCPICRTVMKNYLISGASFPIC